MAFPCMAQETQGEADQVDEIYSGPQTDEPLPELSALPLLEDVAEPVTIVPGAAGKLQLIVFLHERTRPAFGLMRGLAAYSRELGEQIDSSVVFLTDDVGETRQWSINARRAIPEGARMLVSPDGIEGPGSWGLNRNVMMTIVAGRDGRTLGNFAMVQPSAEADMKKVSSLIARLLEIDAPSESKIAAWIGQRQGDARGSEAVDIRPLLAPVIRKTATPEEVRMAATKVEERAARDSAFRIAVGNACRRIVDVGVLQNYGTEPAQACLKSWAESFRDDSASTTGDSMDDAKGKDRPDKDGESCSTTWQSAALRKKSASCI